MLFVDEDLNEILAVRAQREKQARDDYFAYFSGLAVDYYLDFIWNRRAMILEEMMKEAIRGPYLSTIRVPIHRVHTYQATSPLNREARRLCENAVYNTGAWFESTSGLNRANIYAIFKHSTHFKNALEAGLGRGMFVTMTSKHVRTTPLGVKEHEVTLWMNLSTPRH